MKYTHIYKYARQWICIDIFLYFDKILIVEILQTTFYYKDIFKILYYVLEIALYRICVDLRLLKALNVHKTYDKILFFT